MPDVVMVTGTGRSYALGYNLVLRYLETGNTVIASVRKPSQELEELKEKYGKFQKEQIKQYSLKCLEVTTVLRL
ncbi:MAG: hypothetical protein IJM27_05425 [Eubacterium sp.]|nr:hypothetical protein [Eubacterium sp.]